MAQLSKRTHWTLVFSLEDSGCKYMFQFLCALLYTHATPSLSIHTHSLYTHAFLYTHATPSLYARILSLYARPLSVAHLSLNARPLSIARPHALYTHALSIHHLYSTPSHAFSICHATLLSSHSFLASSILVLPWICARTRPSLLS